MRDIVHNIGVAQALAPAVIAATTTGAAVDLSGFGSAAFIINTGAIVGSGDFTAKVQESDTTTDGDFTDVASSALQGSLPASLAANSVVKVGYVGFKKNARLVITKNSGTSIAVSASVVKGDAAKRPVT